MLEKRGCKVDVANNGLEALALFAVRTYAMVFMDCQMPELDGYETVASIRDREPRGTRTPIIAMTANAMPGDREKCIACGMDDYIAKPISPQILDTVLARWAADGQEAAPARA